MYTVYTRILVLLTAVALLAACDTGSAPSDLGTNTTVSFSDATRTVSEDEGTVSFSVTVSDPGYKEFSVQLVRTSATLGADEFDAPETVTIDFPTSVTSGETFSYEIEVFDDDLYLEDDETITYELQSPSNASLGEASTFTLTVEDDDIVDPPQTIIDARQQSLGTEVTVRGIVTRKEGSNVFIQDESGPTGASGIVVRDGDEGGLADAFDAGDIQPGDEIQATGELGAFSGLLQVSGDVSYVQIARDSQTLPPAQSVTVADLVNGGAEDYESELVRIEDLTIDPDGDTEFGENANYDATDASTTQDIAVRVTDDSFYAGQPVPTTAVTLTSVVGQFNFGFGGARGPDTGSQLLPLVEGDIQ